MTSPEMNPPLPPRLIEPSELEAISHQLWDSPIYGAVAANWLDFTSRNRAHASAYRCPDGGYDLKSHFADTQYVADRSRILSTMRTMHPDLPYALTMQAPDETERSAWAGYVPSLVVSPAALSTLRIGNYLVRRNLVDHPFHGTFGKALDVLAVVSGQKRPKDIGASHVDIPFINYVDLAAQVPDMPLSKTQKTDLIPRINNLARVQVQRSGVGKHGEIILEGMVFITSGKFYFEKIAQDALATVVPAGCRPGSAVATHLRRLYGVPTI